MSRPRDGSPHGLPADSYLRIVANLASVLAVLAAITYCAFTRTPREAAPRPSPPQVAGVPADLPKPVELLPPAPALPAPAEPDRSAVKRAEAELAAARRDHERAEQTAQAAAAALADATRQARAAALATRTLGERMRDPSARLARVQQRGAVVHAERDKLQAELGGLANVPHPKRKSLVDRTPVARPAEGQEFHFEVRRNRVTFIDLERLYERVRADARLRIRMTEDRRPIVSTIGPVGAFSMRYELERSLPAAVEDMLDMHGPTYNLRSWEIVPEFEGRGESYEMAFTPAADFSRTIHRLSPSRATITMWVYPDGFALYRKLRDALHARGFLVAARPLPEGMPIRGSPAGSLSAGQ